MRITRVDNNRWINMTTLGRAFKGVFDAAAHNIVMKTAPRTHILLACMPKSGSTFLSDAIGRLPGLRKTSLVSHYGRTEQEINFGVALRKSKYNFIAQQHVRFNAKTADAIETFQLTPVVLVRDIFDCVISVRDHWRRESFRTPTAYVLEDHLEMNDEELDRMIVQMVVPWYFNFFVSWTQCKDALWLRYEDVIRDPAEAIAHILERAGHAVDRDVILESLHQSDPVKERKNVGRPGRGACLPEAQKRIVREYRSFYPDIDFSRIGLE